MGGAPARAETLTIVLTGGVVGFAIIVAAFNMIKGKLSSKDVLCEIEIVMDGKSKKVKSMLDTGNLLKEPLTGAPVIIVEKQELYEVIPKEILNNLSGIIVGGGVLGDPIYEEYLPKIKIIPFSSLGKENGILMGIKVDCIIINYEEKDTYVEGAIVGIYDGSLNGNGKYNALIGLEILGEKESVKNEYIGNNKKQIYHNV